MTMSDDFLKFELEQIIVLQEKLQFMEPVLVQISKQFNPTRAFHVFGPLLTSLTGESLVEILVAMSFADYVSLLMKWVLREHRPYWWVRETDVYSILDRPQLRQHALTCETTAGGPSSHAVITTVILYLQGRWLVNYLNKKMNWDRDVLQLSVFASIGLVLLATWASRMYFGCHFFHQCVAGTTLALSVVACLEQDEIRKEILKSNRKRAVGIALGMLLTVGAIYGGMIVSGVDPQWSVRMAFKWCQDVTYMKPETTPMYGMIKTMGSIFGLACSAPLIEKIEPSPNRWKSIPVTIGFLVINHVILSKAPKDHGCCMFLLYVFGAAALHTYSLVTVAPKLWKTTEQEPQS